MESPLNLVLNEKNAATHPPEQIAALVKSFKKFGFIGSVIVGTDLRILAGHGRVMAALEAGFDHIPVIDVSHLSEELQDAYMIAENKISEMKGWNEDLLMMEIDRLTEIDPSLSGLGFGDMDLDALLDVSPIIPAGPWREHEERKDNLPSPDDDFDHDEGREQEKEDFDTVNRDVHRDELKVIPPSEPKSGIKELTCPHCGEVFKARKQDCAA